ncbi:MAG: hypothetical protein BWX96_03053 [Bacteroidetes bacterium ADurb.Bin145]|nr:MAG: hypothetical protein BWX96_03053 [Bacteroidetes bacterium ADurb.Bin145]
MVQVRVASPLPGDAATDVTLPTPLTTTIAELSLPVISGSSQSILILYPVPVAVPAGMAILIFPDGFNPLIPDKEPIWVALSKLPSASER